MGCRTDLTGRQPHRRSWRIAASAVFRPHRYCPSTNLRYWSAFWCRLYRRLTCSPLIDEVVIFPHSSQPVTEMGPITTARSPVRNCRAALVSVPFPWLRRLTARGARRKTTEARYIPWNFPLYFSPCSFPRKLLLLPPKHLPRTLFFLRTPFCPCDGQPIVGIAIAISCWTTTTIII